MVIDNSLGAVEVSGIVITNDMPGWVNNEFNGEPLRIGANGVAVHTDSVNTFVNFNCPVVLTAAQTWRNAKVRTIDVGGTVTLTNALSSATGVSTPIVLDGFNRIDPSQKAMTAARTTFAFKHNNTYLSAYAHNQNILVKEGQSVTKGQKIAEMGNTDADQVKLHFEVRRSGKPVDPLKYLPPR